MRSITMRVDPAARADRRRGTRRSADRDRW
jgi:hypothetical protein